MNCSHNCYPLQRMTQTNLILLQKGISFTNQVPPSHPKEIKKKHSIYTCTHQTIFLLFLLLPQLVQFSMDINTLCLDSHLFDLTTALQLMGKIIPTIFCTEHMVAVARDVWVTCLFVSTKNLQGLGIVRHKLFILFNNIWVKLNLNMQCEEN